MYTKQKTLIYKSFEIILTLLIVLIAIVLILKTQITTIPLNPFSRLRGIDFSKYLGRWDKRTVPMSLNIRILLLPVEACEFCPGAFSRRIYRIHCGENSGEASADLG